MENAANPPASPARHSNGPGLAGITLATVFLWLASEQFESILRPWLGGFFGELTNSLEPQWALLVEHHLLSWSQWVPIVVFGLAAGGFWSGSAVNGSSPFRTRSS